MTEIATIYGGALYDLAAGENLSLEILGQLKVLQSCFETEPTFAKLLSAYHVPKAERCKIIDDSFTGKVHPYVMNFLKILTEKGYVRHFSDCCEAYCVRYNQANNILPVTAVTAVAMDAGQQERLLKKLEDLTQKTVQLTNRIDPEVLGGVRLDFDGKCVDDTLTHRLESLRHLLNHTIL